MLKFLPMDLQREGPFPFTVQGAVSWLAGPFAFGRQHFRGEVGDRANCLPYSWKAEDEEGPEAFSEFTFY